MIRRIIFTIIFLCGIILLFAPFEDLVQNEDYYRVKADGTWQEPPNPNVCNTHAANMTGTNQNRNCMIFYMAIPIGMLFAGSFFGLLDYRLRRDKAQN